MRELFEAREEQFLKPYAIKSKNSLGRRYPEPPAPNRTCFQRDTDRIIHSKAFRRLKHKTQVFVAHESDHYRSRLTHTIEVSHISRHIARLLSVQEDLSEAISLAHDLGHTPFGHAGEQELNVLMRDFGGFEHNQQSLRVVDELEPKYPYFPGLNLTYEVREGLMKHSSPWDQLTLELKHPSIESQIVNIGDEIAYNNHDLDDGISSRFLNIDDLIQHVDLWREAKEIIEKDYADLTVFQLLHLINSHLIFNQINDVVIQTEKNIQKLNIQSVADVKACKSPIVTFSPEMLEKNSQLRKFLLTNFYSHPTVQHMMTKGKLIIQHLFSSYIKDTSLLPRKYQDKISQQLPKERVICDYIAGMTDNYAEKEYALIL